MDGALNVPAMPPSTDKDGYVKRDSKNTQRRNQVLKLRNTCFGGMMQVT